MTELIQCATCHHQNRTDAKFCAHCGHDLEFPPAEELSPPAKVMDAGSGIIQEVKQSWTQAKNLIKNLLADSEPAGTPAPQTTVKIVSRSSNLTQLLPGAIIDDVSIVLQVFPLDYSNYYLVFDRQCSNCRHQDQPDPGGVCAHCHLPLPRFLVHETSSNPSETSGNLPEPELIHLSANSPFIVPHYRVRYGDERNYVWLPPLAQWRSLAKVKTPLHLAQVIAWGQHIASALMALNGYSYYDPHPSGIEKIIIDGNTACLANLTSFRQLPAKNKIAGVGRDTAFLARVLYHLATGSQIDRRKQPDTSRLPSTFKPVIEQGIQGDYPSVEQMSTELSRCVIGDEYSPTLKPVVGQLTNPGQVRTNNEDNLFSYSTIKAQATRDVIIGLYIVADGMGGHAAGEIASKRVIDMVSTMMIDWITGAVELPGLKFITSRLSETPEAMLRAAVQKANLDLYQQARSSGNNMGTTLTAALLIGDTAYIANVGDSRTCLLHNGNLEQVTHDHSLVASMVAAGIIQPQEIRAHPQRNQIYRSLGNKPQLEVDVFTRTLQRGDQLLLCSDGLWEMVLDDDIKKLVYEAVNPQAACENLIQKANQAGGEDNITAIVVKLE